MKYLVLSIRDRAADAFGAPMFMVSMGGAIRGFADEINRPDEKNQFHKHPEDFDMYELGTFDDGTAKFELLEKPRQVAVGKDLVRG